jgi:hypothetical protein
LWTGLRMLSWLAKLVALLRGTARALIWSSKDNTADGSAYETVMSMLRWPPIPSLTMVWIETTETLWLDHQCKESKMVSQAIVLVTCWLSTLQTREQKPTQSAHGRNKDFVMVA